MANKRSYEDACGAARALDLIGERWALLVVRELLLGPKRFTDLRSGLPGISPNVLTQRLTELEEDGIIARRKLPPPAGSWVYELTQWGIELGPIVMDLGRWGARSPVLGHHTGLSPDAMAISLRTMFDAAASKKAKAKGRFELRFGDDVYHAEIDGALFEIARGPSADPDAVITTAPPIVAGLVYFGLDADQLIREGSLTVAGSRAAFDRFITLFTLPEPVRQAVS